MYNKKRGRSYFWRTINAFCCFRGAKEPEAMANLALGFFPFQLSSFPPRSRVRAFTRKEEVGGHNNTHHHETELKNTTKKGKTLPSRPLVSIDLPTLLLPVKV